MIGSALNKTCQLDPVPTWLVKDVGQLLSPFIALLFNKSLASGIFPSDFKHAAVRPLPKKNGLDISDLKNFRPLSNLSFLSKVLVRIIQRRLQAYLDDNMLMPVRQSAICIIAPKWLSRRCSTSCCRLLMKGTYPPSVSLTSQQLLTPWTTTSCY